jgi:hypothetical protein
MAFPAIQYSERGGTWPLQRAYAALPVFPAPSFPLHFPLVGSNCHSGPPVITLVCLMQVYSRAPVFPDWQEFCEKKEDLKMNIKEDVNEIL